MDRVERRNLGTTSVELTPLGFGGGPLGELFRRVTDDEAQATLEAAWRGGVRYFDTAPYYGRGLSEHRVGRFLRSQARDEAILWTKVGRILRPSRRAQGARQSIYAGGLPFKFSYDYTYDGVMRSYEDSLQRLALQRIDLLVVHDTGYVPLFLDLFEPDFFLVAMRYTLLEQDILDTELARCAESGVGLIIGAVFNSGILASGAIDGAKHDYHEPSRDVIDRVDQLQEVCRRYDVPLAAAALQFPLGHPSVASVIPGAVSIQEVETIIANLDREIPPQLWTELKASGLLRSTAPVPA